MGTSAARVAAIAQLGERQTEDLKVPGSIPGLGIYPGFIFGIECTDGVFASRRGSPFVSHRNFWYKTLLNAPGKLERPTVRLTVASSNQMCYKRIA